MSAVNLRRTSISQARALDLSPANSGGPGIFCSRWGVAGILAGSFVPAERVCGTIRGTRSELDDITIQVCDDHVN